MQTFLPYKDFDESAAALDMKRLGKQRVEATQILETLILDREMWANHPATVMWRGCEVMLWFYIRAMCNRWTSLGYQDSQLNKANELLLGGLHRRLVAEESKRAQPWWLGGTIHLIHQSNLISKDPDFYRPKFPGAVEGLPLIWPAERTPVELEDDLMKEMFNVGSLRH